MIMFSEMILIALILRLTTACIWMVILRENWSRTDSWLHSVVMLYVLWTVFAMIGIVGNQHVGLSWLAAMSYTIGNLTHLLLALVVRKALNVPRQRTTESLARKDQ